MSLYSKHKTLEVIPNSSFELEEFVVEEVSYKVFLNDEYIGSSMVLPCNLEEFGVGFLFSQGYIQKPEDIESVRVCDKGGIFVYTKDKKIEKKDVIITSGCGGTGKISRDMLERPFEELKEYKMKLSEIDDLIRETLKRNEIGNLTHCVHACGFWSEKGFEAFYADVGRHNAVDKVVGAILLRKFSPRGAIYTTGRLTSDMVLKCARIGIPIVISRTATSSLGLEIARRADVTLICYARPGRINVFNRPDRVVWED
ncbi:formate dehydrogenase family accessory protein FdhD [Desulfurobacterium thermolithotrophum DSM 11699]|uniref:Sulfur carrier protein FdhD n=1 Tax=Desulfurobacterium thermolithotrophum (strain DSM 11699 / BSA) TaxID=868864 RepID=F0S3P5_DESTD|nr:formate dehydrogenase accessory sulfurtransferase FdhD [Desulfurobacterium thermolithotrophum]ADY73467.1 formate dehydrogenase family accessory protein FdhD [Desulfurobacterium thermolithotrophum DSM 11699]